MASVSDVHTILVADDNRDSAETTGALLESRGYRVVTATSAREALAHLDEGPQISLVVTDIRMPDVDGFDLLRVVRHRFGSLPVVLMTGLPVTDDDVVPSGAAILAKPFSCDELILAVSAGLDGPTRGEVARRGGADASIKSPHD